MGTRGPKERPRVPCSDCGRPRPDPGVCRLCAKTAVRRAAGIGPREKTTYREQQVRWRYGISPEDFRALDSAHGGLCALCKRRPSTKRRLHIDHCHTTGRIRGLLCHHCNTGLGAFREDPALLAAAIAYLAGEGLTQAGRSVIL